MKSISGLGLGLSLVFGFLLLALIAELYYLLWWKKRITNKFDENGTPHFFFIFCFWKNPSSLSRSQHLCSSPNLVHDPQSSSNSNKDFNFMKQELNNLSNFPRFLFTITEETGEDLESEDGGFKNRKQSASRSNLSELIHILETPFLTPNASPTYFTPPLTPSFSDNNNQHFSPFFESEKDAEFNRLRRSPPPKFKFLRDAEEKMMIQTRKNQDEEFITLNIVDDYHMGKDCFLSPSNSHQVKFIVC